MRVQPIRGPRLDKECGCIIEDDVWCPSHDEIRRLCKLYEQPQGHHIAKVALMTHTAEINRMEAELAVMRAQRTRIAIAAFIVDAMSLEEAAQRCEYHNYSRLSRLVRHSRLGWPPKTRDRLRLSKNLDPSDRHRKGAHA